MATVGAIAVFAAVTDSSIASASVFSKMSVPAMLSHHYKPRFDVGVVAGSSVLGMIIPPSAMLIIYSFVAEQSMGEMFLAGVIPGLLLAAAYVGAIWFVGEVTPGFLGGRIIESEDLMTWREIMGKTLPIVALIVMVLGGISTGWTPPVGPGATGSLLGIIIAALRGRVTLYTFWEIVIETGYITAALLFLITAASIILIVVPHFLDLIESMGLSLVWFGIVAVVAAEISLLTPPLGLSCFVIKATLDDDRITLKDVFPGALPFAFVMILLIRFPAPSLAMI